MNYIVINENNQNKNNNKTSYTIIDNLIDGFDINKIESKIMSQILDKNKINLLTTANNEDNKNITIDLGKCEDILKNEYNISKNDSLYILELIKEEQEMKIPKVEYEVYYPFNNSNYLTKLNINLCEGTKIEISIPVKINGPLDIYNPKSGYYNDICYKATSKSGTDITLKDRRNEFVENNMTLCEENCELIEYDYENEKAKCSCDIKTNIPPIKDIKFKKDEFFKSFKDINNIINLNVMKCYKVVFKINGLKKNYGFFIMVSIIIFYFICLLIFVTFSNTQLKKEIIKIIYALKYNPTPIKKEKPKDEPNDKPVIIKKRKKKKKKKLIYKTSNVKNEVNLNEKKIELDKTNEEKNNILSGQLLQNIEDNSDNKINLKSNNCIGENNIIFNKILEKKDFELNSLDFEEGRKLDKRNYWEYYFSLLKNNHPLMFSFSSFNDYNSQIIKILLFFFSFSLDLTVNALFFTDDTMHKIYQDKGQFNFLYQIPQILYSTLISGFIDSLIKNFAFTQDNIVQLKQENELNDLEQKHKKLLQILKIKFIIYFVLTFMTLTFFWYYITCFCGIYVNTQIHLIKDTLISQITSLLIPFGLYLIPGLFRIPALKNEKKSSICLYKFSLILENYLV